MDNINLGLIYYFKIEYSPLSDLLIQDIIKSEKQLMVLYDSIWKDCPDTIRSTGAYTVFYQGGQITVSQTSAESEYN